MEEKYIMIIGGEFENKGAQAMSFITVSRLKKQFPKHKILFISDLDFGKKELKNYKFQVIQNPFIRDNFVGENLVRKVLGKKTRDDHKVSKKLLKKTEYLFDISGYALSSQWGEEGSRFYLKRFEIAHKHNIKTFILPQSIGPFDFGSEDILKEIHDVLENVSLIMPREKQGREALANINIRNNVVQIPDMVLTSREEIDWSLIYKKEIVSKTFHIEESSVAIVPNMRNFDHGNKQEIIDLYKEAIDTLLNFGKKVYLIKHSKEDIEACELMKDIFSNDDRVVLISDDLTPSEFENLIGQFDFSISSRFHSVVHSYKVQTPCLILGWAIKYTELSKIFDQEKYVFDVRKDFSKEEFLEKLYLLDKNYVGERSIIKEKLSTTEEIDDPFNIVFDNLTKGDVNEK